MVTKIACCERCDSFDGHNKNDSVRLGSPVFIPRLSPSFSVSFFPFCLSSLSRAAAENFIHYALLLCRILVAVVAAAAIITCVSASPGRPSACVCRDRFGVCASGSGTLRIEAISNCFDYFRSHSYVSWASSALSVIIPASRARVRFAARARNAFCVATKLLRPSVQPLFPSFLRFGFFEQSSFTLRCAAAAGNEDVRLGSCRRIPSLLLAPMSVRDALSSPRPLAQDPFLQDGEAKENGEPCVSTN